MESYLSSAMFTEGKCGGNGNGSGSAEFDRGLVDGEL